MEVLIARYHKMAKNKTNQTTTNSNYHPDITR